MQVRIITPDVTVCNQEASVITMPGELGEFGVLPGHELLIASLQAGIAKITTDSSISKYFVYGGIAEVSGTYVNVLTEFASDLSMVTQSDIEEKLASLRIQMDKEKDEINIKAIQSDITRNESLLSFLIVAL